jgi:hypothetical protein
MFENTKAYMIICPEAGDILYLSHAYKNAFGTFEMAWMTKDLEKAKLKLELAQIHNPDVAKRLSIQTM